MPTRTKPTLIHRKLLRRRARTARLDAAVSGSGLRSRMSAIPAEVEIALDRLAAPPADPCRTGMLPSPIGLKPIQQIAAALAMLVFEDPNARRDVGRKATGGAGQIVAQDDGLDEMTVEKVPKQLGLDPISGLIETVHGIRELERVMGIEPTLSAWEAEVLPLNYTRVVALVYGLVAVQSRSGRPRSFGRGFRAPAACLGQAAPGLGSKPFIRLLGRRGLASAEPLPDSGAAGRRHLRARASAIMHPAGTSPRSPRDSA
jgi:hypothetical protein